MTIPSWQHWMPSSANKVSALLLTYERSEAGIEDPEDEEAMLRGLDDELGGLDGGNDDNISDLEDEPDPAIHQAELEAKVRECTQKALAAKKAGDTQTALKFLKEKKIADGELKDWITLYPPGSWQPKAKKAAPQVKKTAAPAQAAATSPIQ